MHLLIWQIFIKHLLYLSHYSRHCKDSSEQKRRPCSHGIYILVELENTQVDEQMQWRKTRQGARGSRCQGKILLLCGEWSGKASPKGERPGEEGWPCGCLGKEHATPREAEMGTVSVSEEQPGGLCAGGKWAEIRVRDHQGHRGHCKGSGLYLNEMGTTGAILSGKRDMIWLNY